MTRVPHTRHHQAIRLLAIGATIAVTACEHATAPSPPASIRVSASALVGTVGTAVAPAPTFAVIDDKGHPVSNIAVTVAVASGGGTLTGAPAHSGAGDTTVGSWVLGPDPGPNTLVVSAAGLTPVTVTATARGGFTVDLQYYGPPMGSAMTAAFENAKARVEAIITGDIPDVTSGSWDVSLCGVSGGGVLPLPIDDIIIYAAADSIDGAGKVLGNAGPCFIRSNGRAPLVGIMRFDTADVRGLITDGRINDVILHEMMHTLGVGTMWGGTGLTKNTGTDSTAYLGANAVSGCQYHGGIIGCATSVPLEANGGGGTRDMHWRDTTSATGIGFYTELMTGYVSRAGTPNPLSRITIGALADLGYRVDYTRADSYTVPGSLSAGIAARRVAAPADGRFAISERLMMPVATLDAAGRVVRIVR